MQMTRETGTISNPRRNSTLASQRVELKNHNEAEHFDFNEVLNTSAISKL